MKKLNLLIVDDEPGIRSGIKRILQSFSVGFPFMAEDFNFNLIEAETGEKALEYINKSEIDIILLDNKLPGIQGIEVLEYIKKNDIDTEVMMITSYASLDLAVKATNNGAYNFVPKPFTPQELKAAIEAITKHLYLKKMTREMNKEDRQIKFQFLSVLSHELKSPINAVEGYLNIMKDKQVGEDIGDYETMIDRSLLRIKGMRSLIMDLLDLTKLQSGAKQRHFQAVDLHEIAVLAINSIEPLAMQRNIKIYLDAQENLYYNADNKEIEIIFNNLLSNAVKYNKPDGSVNISVKKTDKTLEIIVQDTGIGMTEDDISKLFHDFVRIKNIKTREISGTGLGLSIMKKMVDLYNGDINVKSVPDEGSTFVVNLPL